MSMITFLLFIWMLKPILAFRYPISCFSCASEEYEPLYQNSAALQAIGQPMRFDKSCDTHEDVKKFSPAVRCDSSCVTVLEAQYFGGILNERRPYTFIRGCATEIFALANSRFAEIEYLHASEICLQIPVSEIFPDVLSNDLVTVCSCVNPACNIHDALLSDCSSYWTNSRFLSLTFLMNLLLLPFF
ncbi:hypothetical protein M3Y95_01227000 [Aphelenchoides besseyi]|nr:hypothetical protein M3Y95_01227000 [Aphelenchoides besseyi]